MCMQSRLSRRPGIALTEERRVKFCDSHIDAGIGLAGNSTDARRQHRRRSVAVLAHSGRVIGVGTMDTQVHGLLPDHSPAALLILDMLSDFEFPDGKLVARAARRIAPGIARLKARASKAGIACLYVNDNPGRWRSDSHALIEHCRSERSRGRVIVEALLPTAQDYFILKPRHSAFYATPLEVLLQHLGTKRLILTGVSSHQCVLFTANDAHLRNYELVVPSDCIAGPTQRESRFALRYFESVLGTQVRPAARLALDDLNREK